MKISVCMAAFNGQDFIHQQIESILSQLNEGDELIISDDGSSDNTIAIIESFRDIRIKLLNHERVNQVIKSSHYLVTSNFENALMHATGDYIFLADQDDIWLENKISIMLSYLVKYDLVVSDCFVIDRNNKIIVDSFCDLVGSKKGFVKNIIRPTYHGCCMAFNREILQFSLPFPYRTISHDIWIGLLSEFKGKSCFIEDRLILYRKHDLSVSGDSVQSKNSFLFKFIYRFSLIVKLFLRLLELKMR